MEDNREYSIEEILADVQTMADKNEEDDIIASLFRDSEEDDGFASDVDKSYDNTVFDDIESTKKEPDLDYLSMSVFGDEDSDTYATDSSIYDDEQSENENRVEAEPEYEEIVEETEIKPEFEEIVEETEAEPDYEEIAEEAEIEPEFEEIVEETEAEPDYEEIAEEVEIEPEYEDTVPEEAENEASSVYSDEEDSIFGDAADIFAFDKEKELKNPDEDVKTPENNDFSFEKMFNDKKLAKERESHTKVFKTNNEKTINADKLPDAPQTDIEDESEIEKEFIEQRKEKIDKFRLFTENLEGDTFGEEEKEETVFVSDAVKPKKGEDIFAAIEKTDKPKKENSKRREKRKKRESKVYEKIDVGRVKLRLTDEARDIRIRMLVTAVSFVLCLIFGIMKTAFVNGSFSFLSPIMGENPVIAYAIEFLLGLPVLICAVKSFLHTLKNSERFTLCAEAMTAIIILVNEIYNAILLITGPETDENVMFFGTAVCFVALFEIYGESKQNIMIRKNLKAIVKNDVLLGVFALENDSEKIASGISKSKEPTVLCAGEVEIPNSFLDSSLTKDKENTFFNFAIPVSIVLSFVCGGLAYAAYGTVVSFASAVLSALLVSSPVFISPVLISLIARTNETLNRTGCEILGYEDVENIDDTNAIVLDTADIFAGNISHFHLISNHVKVDTLHAFEIACSVINASGGVLKKDVAEFLKEQKLVLPQVEDIKYEEKLGISCWVENKCVLLGNEKMMKEHNIVISPEYSAKKYENEGSKVFYLAVDTYATAMFCADYFIGRQVKKQLADLYKTGVILMLMTTDPHIDEQFVANTLGVSASSIKTVSPVGANQIRENLEKTAKQKRTGLIFRKSVIGFLKVINAAFRLYDVQSLTMLIQAVSMFFAIGTSIALSVAATGYLPGVIFVIAYHIVWALLGYFVTNKNKKQ